MMVTNLTSAMNHEAGFSGDGYGPWAWPPADVGYVCTEGSMETRIFDRSVTVFSTDGHHSETFNRGERVTNIKRIGTRVMFEPVNGRRVAGTYAMGLNEFVTTTKIVREAGA